MATVDRVREAACHVPGRFSCHVPAEQVSVLLTHYEVPLHLADCVVAFLDGLGSFDQNEDSTE